MRVLDVTLTNPDRIYFPELLLTKRQLAEYYAQVAPRMMPLVKDRPLTLLRCPRGRDQHCFYQKHFDRGVPQGCRAVSVQERHAVRQYAAIDQPQGLVALAQLGALELHTWLSRRDRLDRPDQMVLDLDPGEGVSWGVVQEAAVRLHDALAAWNLRAFVRVTGGKGLHVIVPLERRHTWLQVRQVAGVLAQRLQAAAPDRFVAQAAKEKRSAHLFIDYLRNVRGATAIASYSSRGHPRAPIALPISWSELAETSSARILHVDQVLRGALASRPDPWSEMPKIRQRISRQVLQTCADEYVLKG